MPDLIVWLPKAPLPAVIVVASLPRSHDRPDPIAMLQPIRRIPMRAQTQAELFISTLEELRDIEREIRRARLFHQHKAYVDRLALASRAESPPSRAHGAWTPLRGEIRASGHEKDRV